MERKNGSIALPGGASAAESVHRYLRDEILSGRLAAGQVLKQSLIGPALGVSATPVREALRMLHEEGLVDAPPQKRARVVGFDPRQVEALYAERICIEAAGAGIAARHLDSAKLGRLQDAFERMETKPRGATPSADWHTAHRAFHLAAVAEFGEPLLDRVAANIDRSARFIHLHSAETTEGWTAPTRWHESILRAVQDGDPAAATAAMARDLASAALALIAYLTPEYEPHLVRRVCEQYSAVPEAVLPKARPGSPAGRR